MGRLPVTPANGSEESQRLLRNEHDAGGNPEARPQVKWGRMVAGEAFELGDDEDDD